MFRNTAPQNVCAFVAQRDMHVDGGISDESHRIGDIVELQTHAEGLRHTVVERNN